jgi:hypothetical protein
MNLPHFNLSRWALTLVASGFLLHGFAQAATEGKSPRIKKCQDAAGHWHYGDTADEACARSKVLELNRHGVRTSEVAAPLTEAELKAKAAQAAAEAEAKKRAEDQAASDRQLLASYGHEDDIAIARDRKIADIDANIKSTEETLSSLRAAYARTRAEAADESAGGKKVTAGTQKELLNAENQIRSHEALIAAKRGEKEKIRAKSATELARYRELKSRPLPAAAAQPAP